MLHFSLNFRKQDYLQKYSFQVPGPLLKRKPLNFVKNPKRILSMVISFTITKFGSNSGIPRYATTFKILSENRSYPFRTTTTFLFLDTFNRRPIPNTLYRHRVKCEMFILYCNVQFLELVNKSMVMLQLNSCGYINNYLLYNP